MTNDERKDELAKIEAKLADPQTPEEEKAALRRARIHHLRRVE